MARLMIIPGKYEVSNLGRVRNVKTGRILKPSKNNSGYYLVDLRKHGKTQRFLVHRLVATAFIPNPDGLPVVNHINEIKDDNRVENLEWSTHKENANHGSCQQRKSEAIKGSKHPKARKVICLETKQVFDTITQAAEWVTQATEGVKVGRTSIHDCCKGKQKTAGGYHWEYVEEEV